jgi:hypothetical protein
MKLSILAAQKNQNRNNNGNNNNELNDLARKIEAKYHEISNLERKRQEHIANKNHKAANLDEFILYKKESDLHNFAIREAFRIADERARKYGPVLFFDEKVVSSKKN